MNFALLLEWNPEKGEYCKQKGTYRRDFRAPEEYEPNPRVDASADVWPMGSIIFCLLTGMWPYHAEVDPKHKAKMQQLAIDGIGPYINPSFQNSRSSSLIERRLVEIMDQCHTSDSSRRVDIFTVVRHLRETKRLHEQQQTAGG